MSDKRMNKGKKASGSFIPYPVRREAVLASCLREIERLDALTNYAERDELVFKAMVMAQDLHLKAGVRIDPAMPGWPVVYVELPTGQVSWPVAQFEPAYDGHTAEQKYQRATAFFNLIAKEIAK